MQQYLSLIFLFTSFTLAAQNQESLEALISDGQFEKAMSEIDFRLTRANDQDKFLLSLSRSEVLTRTGKFDESENELTKLQVNAKTDRDQALINTSLGFLYLSRGRYDLALKSLEQAITQLEKSHGLESLDGAQAQTHLGNLFITTGQYAQAEEQLNISLLTRQRLLKDNHELIAASYNDLGLLYSFLDADKALAHYEKALKIYQELHGKDHPKIAIANTNIGSMYAKLELFGDAVNNFESSLAIWEKIYPGPHPIIAFLL